MRAFFPLPLPPFNRSKWARREEGERKGEGGERRNLKKGERRRRKTNSRTILKVSKRIFREWVVKRRNERWLVILRSNEKALSRSRKRREEKNGERRRGVRCAGSQGDLDCPLSDLWTDYFFVYSPRFETITYCGERLSSLSSTFKTTRCPVRIRSLWSSLSSCFEKKKNLVFVLFRSFRRKRKIERKEKKRRAYL